MIYLDTAIVIYLVEASGPFGLLARRGVERHPGATLCISPLVSMECLVGPLRSADMSMESRFRRFFSSSIILGMPDEVYEQAARLRAVHRSLKTPGALHWATALVGGCTEIWTGDADFAKLGAPYVRDIIHEV